MSLRLLPLLIILLLSQTRGEKLRFNRLSVEQGLSQSTVNAILEDSRGLMWFGTQDGLNMYDGYSFTVFKHRAADSNSISDNWITSLLQDRQGNIWIGTFEGGLNILPPERDRFIHFTHDTARAGSLAGNNISGLAQDVSGTIWVGIWGGGLDTCNFRTGVFTHFRHHSGDTNSLCDDQVYSLLEDRTGMLWAGTWNGVSRFDPAKDRWTRYLHSSGRPESGTRVKVTGLYQDAAGSLWIGTRDNGLMVFDTTRDRIIPCPARGRPGTRPLRIWSLCPGNGSTFWVGTSGDGIMQCDSAGSPVAHYANDPLDRNSLYSNEALRVFKDSRDLLWIGMEAGGVSILDQQQRRFNSYVHTPNDPQSLSHNVVRAFAEGAAGEIWVGTNGGGLNRLDLTSGRFSAYRHMPGNRTSISDDNVYALQRDDHGTLWIGSAAGLDRFDPATGRFANVTSAMTGGRADRVASVTAIACEHNGTMWVGTYGDGLYRWSPKVRPREQKDAAERMSGIGQWILALHVDGKNRLWIGTWGRGLVRFDLATREIRRYSTTRDDPNSLHNATINCIAETHDGKLWFGTQGGGMDEYEPSSDSFVNHAEQDGLPNNVVYGILEDSWGHLWISTNNGIARFTPATRQSRNFEVHDGLQGNEFNGGAFLRTRGGEFLFGGVDGFTRFRPGDILDNPRIPAIVLTSFRIFDTPARLPDARDSAGTIVLRTSENFFSFEFVAIDYTLPSRKRYAYMIEGFDREWVNGGSRHYASYTHLDPGEYRFRVRGSNNDGVWNLDGASVRIRIIPPFWQTWPFRVFVGATLFLALLLMIRRRIGQFRRRQEAQQEFSRQLIQSQEEERKRIAAELHDSLGQHLVIIKNRALFALESPSGDDAARRQLTEISSVASETLEEIRQIAHNLRPYQLDRLGLTRAIQSIVERVSESTSIAFSSSISNIDTLFSNEAAINVYRIVQELITNVVRHSGATSASVAVSILAHSVEIVVSDNGRGMNPDAATMKVQERGFGLAGISERARILAGTMTMESVPGKGTRTTVMVPVQGGSR